jgi:Fur family ferric uptake transcriptional regulator
MSGGNADRSAGAIATGLQERHGRVQMAAMMPGHRERAESLVQRTGARVTRQRVAVLAVLLAAPRALTHHEVEKRAHRGLGMDRVTVYRVLEWLTARNLAHRIAGDDRVWRFNAAEDEAEGGHAHAHFKCNGCGEVTCLDGVRAARSIRLPSGYHPQEVDLTVKGLCVECVPARKRA